MIFVYLHGFNSDGEGWKAAALRRHFPQAKVIAPDLPAEPEAAIQLIKQHLAHISPTQLYFFGTSLGGFYAYYCSALWQRPAYLFNPSLRPYETLAGRGIGHFKTWTKQRPYHFREAYLEQLHALKAQADTAIDQQLLNFFLADDDDVLDHAYLPHTFPAASFQWVSGAGHGFSKFEKILKQLKM